MNDSKTALDNLVVIYGFFFVMLTFLISGLRELKIYFGEIELFTIYVSMWLLGLCSYFIGMRARMTIMKGLDKIDGIDDSWVNRSLWLFVIVVAVGFVVVLGETLLGDVLIFMEYSFSDAGQGLFFLLIFAFELQKWKMQRTSK